MSISDPRKRGLGRGLSALLGEETAEAGLTQGPERSSRTLPIERLYPGRFQPRRTMAEEELDELARSIGEKGILQPILVRPHPDEADAYEIIAGERRWRAAQRAQLHEVPVLVRDFADQDALEVALVENLQRQDLSPLEEAEGYRRLMNEYGHTQDAVARGVGKSRSHIANTLRLLALPDPVKRLLEAGLLSAGHARALLTADEPEKMAQAVVERGLNVRQTEQLAGSANAGRPAGRPRGESGAPDKDPDTLALERDLTAVLGVQVEIRFNKGGGELLLRYTSLDQLDDILHRLSRGTHGRRGTADKAAPPQDV
jgi:ParB family transcriptional regulator, chromosome partitioning protein